MADEEKKEAHNRYKVVLKSTRGEEFCDVIVAACVRVPFYKKSSFWVLKINTSPHWAQQLFNELASKTLKHFRLIITEVELNDVNSTLIEKQDVHYKEYKCVHAITSSGGYKVNVEDHNTEVIMTLIDYVFYDLSIKKAFNRKFDNTTAFAVINKYEKFLQDKYGSDNFYFNKVNIPKNEDDDQISNYKYEELLLALKNDIQVTDVLMYNKKAVLNPSFYFFDDFYLDKDVKAPITCHFINLGDRKKFKKYDIRKWFDNLYVSTQVTEIPISDPFFKLVQGYDSIIFRRKNMILKHDLKDTMPIFHPIIKKSTEKEYVVNAEGDRLAKIRKVYIEDIEHGNMGNSGTAKKRQNHLVFYEQDDLEHTKKRFKNYRLFIERKLKQYMVLQTQDCFCEWVQFGRCYNLEVSLGHQDKYVYTPIAIENVFYKEAGKDLACKHTVRSLMIEYYDNDDQFCSNCDYYGSNYCKLHYISVHPESWCYDYKPPSFP
jgi:hypothetical protein